MKKYTEDLRSTLAKLPVPDLENTLKELNEWVKPVVSSEELLQFETFSERFAKQEGPVLQRALEEHAQNTTGSWLAPFWIKSYLNTRGDLQSETNFSLTIRPEYHQHLGSINSKAAQIIERLTLIFLSLINETYPLELDPKGNNVDMSYYRNLFKSCRLPDSGEDKFFVGDDSPENNHIIVIKDSNFYQLKVTDNKGKAISADELHANLCSLSADKNEQGFGVESLSGANRDLAYQTYEELGKKIENQHILHLIKNALFIIGLPSSAPESTQVQMKEGLLGWQDQWFSKTMQLLIHENGAVSLNFEHTAIDGVPVLNVLSQVFTECSAAPLIEKQPESQLLTKLDWLLTPEAMDLLNQCKEEVQQVYEGHAFVHHEFSHFGKALIKKAKISPDAFFHIALALAQYEQFGQLQSVYEPVAMRHYYEGRTASARSISQSKKELVSYWFQEEQAPDRSLLIEKIHQAAAAHTQRIGKCQMGQGVERHLFGLSCINQLTQAQPEKANYFLQADSLKKMQSDFISSTGIPFPILASFTFGPVNPVGFGLYYSLLSDRIIIDISAKKEQQNAAKELSEKIVKYLEQLAELLDLV